MGSSSGSANGIRYPCGCFFDADGDRLIPCPEHAVRVLLQEDFDQDELGIDPEDDYD